MFLRIAAIRIPSTTRIPGSHEAQNRVSIALFHGACNQGLVGALPAEFGLGDEISTQLDESPFSKSVSDWLTEPIRRETYRNPSRGSRLWQLASISSAAGGFVGPWYDLQRFIAIGVGSGQHDLISYGIVNGPIVIGPCDAL